MRDANDACGPAGINVPLRVNTIDTEGFCMKNRGFEGWYFKHLKGDDALAFIPGRAETGAFIQMLSPNGSRQFDVPGLTVRNGVIPNYHLGLLLQPYSNQIQLFSALEQYSPAHGMSD